jgi:hypothetical protein
MIVALTLLDFQYICQWCVRSLSMDKGGEKVGKVNNFLFKGSGLEWKLEQK